MEIQLGVIESRFAELIWANAPVSSHELVKLSAEEFGWARTTTHNVIRKLCDKGLFENNKGIVSARVTREEYATLRSRRFVEDSFDGSLPAFIAAFTKGRRLTAEEAAELRRMIEEAGEEE